MKDSSLSAGDFSTWLDQTHQALLLGKSDAKVPCGSCTACCRSSLFIHIKPHETESLKSIPKGLLFPAPGLPKGNVLLGYNENGHCPMFKDNKCSIYKTRPETCREFDCRIFAATSIHMDNVAQRLITEQAKSWRFDFSGDKSREDHSAVLASAKFLKEQAHLFPNGSLPKNPTQIALLAIKVYRVFRESSEVFDEKLSDTEIVTRILEEINIKQI